MKLKTKGKRGSIPQLFPKEFQSKSQNLMFEVMCSNISSIYQWCILQIRNQGREAPSMFFLREQTSQGKVRKTISRALAKLLPFTTFFSYYGSHIYLHSQVSNFWGCVPKTSTWIFGVRIPQLRTQKSLHMECYELPIILAVEDII